jgi:hypothetical protein
LIKAVICCSWLSYLLIATAEHLFNALTQMLLSHFLRYFPAIPAVAPNILIWKKLVCSDFLCTITPLSINRKSKIPRLLL